MLKDFQTILKTITDQTCFNLVKKYLSEKKAFLNKKEAYEYSLYFEKLEFLKRPKFESIDYNHSWMNLVEKKDCLKLSDLSLIRSFLFDVFLMKKNLKEIKINDCEKIEKNLFNEVKLEKSINQIIDLKAHLKKDASSHLKTLFQLKTKMEKNIQNALKKALRHAEKESLIQDKILTDRYYRWVLSIKSPLKKEFKGIVHASSQSGKTQFMEPYEVIPLNNELEKCERDIEKEIKRILKKISEEVFLLYPDLIHAQNKLIFLEALWSEFYWIKKNKCQAFIWDEDFKLNGLFYPLIEEKSRVKNDFYLSEKALLLSGPNGGGKTILLKSVALCVLLSKRGLYLPVSLKSSLPFIEKIYDLSENLQDVNQKLSSFTGKLKGLNEALKASDKDLILIDEMGSETEPDQGGALSQAFLDEYVKNQSWFIATSHLERLKRKWNEKIIHGHLEFKEGKTTYKFIKGLPSQSFSLEIAKKHNTSQKIIDQALFYLGDSFKKKNEYFSEIEEVKKNVKELELKLKTEIKQTQKERFLLEDEKKKMLDENRIQMNEFIEKAQKSLKDKIKENKSHKVSNYIESLKKKLKKEEDLKDEFNLRRGDLVFIPSLKKTGIVQTEVNSKGEVLVLSQSMSFWFKLKDLKLQQRAKKEKGLEL